jgi:DNA-directed RNA polymerase subunit K/omega
MDLKSLELAKRRVGGTFRLSVLLQKRIIELVRGAPATVDNAERERSPIEVALREVLEGKIELEMIPEVEFTKLVEQARLEKEGRARAQGEDEPETGIRPIIDVPDIGAPG